MEDNITYSTPNGTIFKLDTFKGKRVLVGDYSSFSYFNTKMVLDSLGIEYDIERTMYGIKQRLLNGNKYDFIFTNNIYQNGTGVILLEELKKIANFNTPVIIHTISDNDNNHFIDLGFDGYLKKPIKQEDTIKLLTSLLQTKKERDC